MTTSDEMFNKSTNKDDGAINRRRVLKGAVAAGVGVAAWSQPSIRQLGSTPAYATHTDTTTVPTPITASTSLNANNANAAACVALTGFDAQFGNNGSPGEVLIDIPDAVRIACGTSPSEKIVVDVRGCVGAPGSAFVRNQTQGGGNKSTSLSACGFCCQVSAIFVSKSGNTLSEFVEKPITGGCDPKTFEATTFEGSSGFFLKASIICEKVRVGDCCPGGPA